MDRPEYSTREQGTKVLDRELADLDVVEEADKVTGGSGDPCEGGQFHLR